MPGPKPDAMHYESQAIICLDRGLHESGLAANAKRRLAGDSRTTILGREVDASKVFLGPQVVLPQIYQRINSRLIIIAHGEPSSSQVLGDLIPGGFWDGKLLATKVDQWLDGCEIKRISLRMCYGGGSRAGKTGTDNWSVKPEASFAYEFAAHCSNANDITARTGISSTEYAYTSDEFEESKVTWTRELTDYEHKGKEYKVVYFPQPGACPDKRVPPKYKVMNV